MMNREDLIIGNTYIDTTNDDGNIYSIKVLHIGASSVFYEPRTNDTLNEEDAASIDSVLKLYKSPPKPKKTITLVGFFSKEGNYCECLLDSESHLYRVEKYPAQYKEVSRRTIEVSE